MASADGPQLTWMGKLLIVAIVAASLFGAYQLFLKGRLVLPNMPSVGGKAVEIGLAYGTEKRQWMEWAVQEFAKTPSGRRIQINLYPMGSLEGAQAFMNNDQRMTVWSPASSMYKDVFVQQWQYAHNNQQPILKEEALALTPMVFVIWDERYQAFTKKYGTLNFTTMKKALSNPGGWESIAGKPEWGVFKFGHTFPSQSNSGLMTLVLMGYEFHQTTRALTMSQLLDVDFQNYMRTIETAVTGQQASTDTMMREMVLKGPSTYDCISVYENVVIEYLKNAEGRWGTLHVVYPRRNMWNDNPYYIIDAAWTTSEQKKAAGEFLTFLMSTPVQQQALTYGFRPGNPDVPVRGAQSPFTQYGKYGIQIDVPSTCESPKPEVINNLLASWQRAHGTQ